MPYARNRNPGRIEWPIASRRRKTNRTPPESVIANRDLKRRLTNGWANREASRWARRASRPDGVSAEADIADRDTVPSQHRRGGCVGFAQQTKEERVQYALALAAPLDVHRRWDRWLWFGHFLFDRLIGYARTLEDCLRDVISDAAPARQNGAVRL